MEKQAIDKVATRVLEALEQSNARGEARARPQAAVARLARTSPRALQQATLLLNQRGVAVVTTCRTPPGIYLAESDAELAAYDGQLDHRIRGLARRLVAIRRIRRARAAARPIEPNGQRRMFA